MRKGEAEGRRGRGGLRVPCTEARALVLGMWYHCLSQYKRAPRRPQYLVGELYYIYTRDCCESEVASTYTYIYTTATCRVFIRITRTRRLGGFLLSRGGGRGRESAISTHVLEKPLSRETEKERERARDQQNLRTRRSRSGIRNSYFPIVIKARNR